MVRSRTAAGRCARRRQGLCHHRRHHHHLGPSLQMQIARKAGPSFGGRIGTGTSSELQLRGESVHALVPDSLKLSRTSRLSLRACVSCRDHGGQGTIGDCHADGDDWAHVDWDGGGGNSYEIGSDGRHSLQYTGG